MTEIILSLRTALRTVLEQAGIILHDETRNTPMPYASFGDCSVRLWSDGVLLMADHRLAIQIWSRAQGDAEALTLAGRIMKAIETASMPRPNIALIRWSVIGQEMRRPTREGIRSAILRISALTQHDKGSS